jgi:acyl-CoA synthetase (AMP-forming)/AMP-acid ligase II
MQASIERTAHRDGRRGLRESGAMNLFNLLPASAERFGGHGAIYRGDEQWLSFAQLEERARRLAGTIAAAAGPDGRVLICSANCPEYVELLFATWAAGAAAVPVNAKLHPAEVSWIVEDCRPSLGFVSAELAAGLRDATAASAIRWIVIGSPDYEALLAAAPIAAAETSPDDLAWLFYTSGTTGRSKGAMLSHRNIRAMLAAHLADMESVEPGHSLIHAAPMSHGSGIYILPYLARGARQVVPASGQFDPVEILALCDVHPGCGMFLAPTMVRRLRIAAEESGRRPRNLRSIVYGGGPMYLDEIKQSLATFGPVFSQIYGQGEAPMTITGLSRSDHESGDERLLGSVGWARTGVEARVAGPDGAALPRGEIGEILCRGDVVMNGYWRNDDATATTLRGGWLWTGDIGVMDEDGLVSLRDRSKDVIISGGSNIYPREIEDVLLTHQGVAEACVVGLPDEEWGEVPVAFVVASPGASVSAAALDALCLARIARFKRPRDYRFVASLPKNAYGKVLKRELAASLAIG